MRNLYNFVSFYQNHQDIFHAVSRKSENILQSLTAESQDDAQSNILQSLTAKSPIRLSWTHYSIILQENSKEARDWYEQEAAREMWGTRTLQRNVSSQYYHRLLQSQNVTYSQKVFDYLAEHREDEVFQKIYNMEQLTIVDVHELERIMWEELGTKEQYEEYCQRERKIYGGNVAAMIRSLCGIDRAKAHQKFYEFIRTEQLTSIQEEYLDSILNYVCANGDMERRTLGQDPYREFNWQLAFGDNRAKVGNYVDHLHHLIEGVQPFVRVDEENADYQMAAE